MYLKVFVGFMDLLFVLGIVCVIKFNQSYPLKIVKVHLKSHRRHFKHAVGGAVCFLLISFWIIFNVAFWKKLFIKDTFDFLMVYVHSPGTVFIFAFAVITATGFLVTITGIHELGMKITRYDDLLIKATNLMRDALKNKDDSTPTIRMLCTTPLHGNATQRDSAHYEKYKQTLERVCDDGVFHILHLPKKRMEEFYDRFSEADLVSEDDAKTAFKETLDFLMELDDENRKRKRRNSGSSANSVHIFSHLLPTIDYRLLISNNRAIFYVPLNLPSGDQIPGSQNNENGRRLEKVEMVGFETEDPVLVAEFKANFDSLSHRSMIGGAEDQETITTISGELRISVMRSIVSHVEDGKATEQKEAILFVHGLTASMNDERWKDRLSLRGESADIGYRSYEFDFRGRGRDIDNERNFSLATATEDLCTVLQYLFENEKYNRVWIIGRGMGAYIALACKEVYRKKCPMIFWQPIFYPDRTMEDRGHVNAFFNVYLESADHHFVEIGNVKLYRPFFEHLSTIQPPEELVRDKMKMHILFTEGDRVTKSAWLEKFLSKIQERTDLNVEIDRCCLDSPADPKDHFHDQKTSMQPFIDKTLQILEENGVTKH